MVKVSGAIWVVLIAIALPSVAHAQIETSSARTTRDQGSAVRLKASNLRINDSTDTFTLSTSFMYSVWPSSMFFVSQSYVAKNGSISGTDVESDGLGDLVLGAKWRFYRHDEILESFQLAVVAGIKFGSGDEDETDAGMLLPPMLQPGHGSTDYFAAFVLTHRVDRYEIDAELLLRENRKDDGFEFGDIIKANVAFSYRLSPDEFPESGIPDQVNVVVELLSQWQEHHQMAGAKVADSGGFRSMLGLGLQYIPSSGTSLFEIELQFPLVKDLRGTQDGPDWVVLLGARFFI